MSDHPNAKRVRRLYERSAGGDVEVLVDALPMTWCGMSRA